MSTDPPQNFVTLADAAVGGSPSNPGAVTAAPDAWPAAADYRLLDQLPDAPDIDVARAFYCAGDPHLLR
jgi:hypothetical protein